MVCSTAQDEDNPVGVMKMFDNSCNNGLISRGDGLVRLLVFKGRTRQREIHCEKFTQLSGSVLDEVGLGGGVVYFRVYVRPPCCIFY